MSQHSSFSFSTDESELLEHRPLLDSPPRPSDLLPPPSSPEVDENDVSNLQEERPKTALPSATLGSRVSRINLTGISKHDATVNQKTSTPMAGRKQTRSAAEKSAEKVAKFYLRGLELFNFKSYNGKHIVGPFTEFTAVVGSNGAGKSNLMDAICFALCIKSDKLRAKKFDHLVSNHSSAGDDDDDDDSSPPDPRFRASVKLVFQSRENDEERTSVTRAITKKSCLYFVDDVERTQADYVQHLTQLGLNVKNKLFLLFQGTIDALVTRDTKQFTKIIEELSGSGQYANEYDDLKKKLDGLDNQLKSLKDKRKGIGEERQLFQQLQRQQVMVENVATEIANKKTQMILLEVNKYVKELATTLARLEEAEHSLEEMNEAVNNHKQAKKAANEAFDKANKELQAVAKEFRQSELVLAQNDCNSLRDSLKASKRRLENAKRNRDEIERQRTAIAGRIEELKTQIEQVKAEKDQVTTRLENASQELNISTQDITNYNGLKNQFQQQVADLTNFNVRGQERDLALLKQKLDVYSKEQEKIKAEIDSLQEQIKDNDDRIVKYNEEIDKWESELAKFKAEHDRIVDEKKKLVDEEKELKDQIAQDAAELKRMLEVSKRNQKQKNMAIVMDYLMKSYPGKIYGRFASLCRPENKKYHAAFLKVCGQYQNAIVVDSFETIQRMKQNEPRSVYQSETFLALDTIKAKDRRLVLRNIRRELEATPMLDLLRKPNNIPNIDIAMRFVVGDALVCPDREKARTVAYELDDGDRYHDVISLSCLTYFRANGEISCSFGGKDTRREIFDQDELDEKEAEFRQLTQQLQEVRQKLENFEIELDPINNDILRLESHKKISQNLINHLKTENEKFNEKIDKLTQDAGKVGEEIGIITTQIQQLEEQLAAHHRNVEQLEQQVFGEFLRQVGGGQFESLKEFEAAYYQNNEDDLKRLDELTKRSEKLKNELATLENKDLDAKKQVWDKNIENEEQKGKELEAKLKEAVATQEEKKKAHEELKKKFEESKKAVDEASARLKKSITELGDAYAAKEATEKNISNLKQLLSSIRKSRHTVYRKAFVDAIQLPVENGEEEFRRLFATQSDDDQAEKDCYEAEDNLVVDYTLIQDFIREIENDQDYVRIMLELESDLKEKEGQLAKMTIAIDANLEQKVREKNNEYTRVNKQVQNVQNEILQLSRDFRMVKRRRADTFSRFVEKAQETLDQVYKTVTQSESAQAFLIEENPEEPYLGGVQYSCIVSNRAFQPISQLSGGEKSLAAFAFIFSLYFEQWPAFFVLDEIDGPLDPINVDKLVTFVKTQLPLTQFIFITHKPTMYPYAHSLIGVSRQNSQGNDRNVRSRSFSLDLRQYDDTDTATGVSVSRLV